MAESCLKDSHQDSHRGGTYRRIELITGEARRRRWTEAEKVGILAESFRPGACVAEVARRHGVSRSLLCNGRREVREPRAAGERRFVPIRIVEEAGAARAPVTMEREEGARGPAAADLAEGGGAALAVGTINIATGKLRVRVSGAVGAAALQQVLAYLGRRT